MVALFEYCFAFSKGMQSSYLVIALHSLPDENSFWNRKKNVIQINVLIICFIVSKQNCFALTIRFNQI